MLHLTLAGNLLRSIGGKPRTYGFQYTPYYPQDIFYDTRDFKLNLLKANRENIGIFTQVR